MFMKHFPVLVERTEVTVHNVEDILVKYVRLLNDFIESSEQSNKPSRFKVLRKLKRS